MGIRQRRPFEESRFDKPSARARPVPSKPVNRDEPEEDRVFRLLLEDPEACWHWERL